MKNENNKLKISVCIIARNEEGNIGKCFESLSKYKFEIILVDTGSNDRTKEIAQNFTEHVYDYCWSNDFSAAKNFAVQKATNEYVMLIDSDEYIETFDAVLLMKMIERHGDEVGRIQRINTFQKYGGQEESKEWINRIFSKSKYHYEGRIHEQIVSKDKEAYRTYRTNIRILHSGYDLSQEQKKKKTERNISLLEMEVMENGKSPYVLYQLGKSHYMAKEYEESCKYFEEGLSYDLDPNLEYLIDMVETYGYALINSRQYRKALAFEQIYDVFGNSADFQFLMGLIYMNNALFKEAVNEFEKAAKHSDSKVKGTNSYLAYYNIGVIYECLENYRGALEHYSLCGNYILAKERFDKLKAKFSDLC